MENIIKSAKNCYNLNLMNNNLIDWRNSSGDIINVTGFLWIPNLIYQRFNDTHYQWCGPRMMFVEYFAKFTGTR